ncbi:Hypothetical protein CINCED_3A016222 [Cinara cedri]|uniref:Uncharacterized protein n=1 Tax=Cinara cedri TaxID=506608 RepID=A0A5E4NT00_9HEMI|nr:Hypothetical protein CINCED_3A016222 [Cinara cedri]
MTDENTAVVVTPPKKNPCGKVNRIYRPETNDNKLIQDKVCLNSRRYDAKIQANYIQKLGIVSCAYLRKTQCIFTEMEQWFKTDSIRPENRQPTTIAESKKNNNGCCKINSLELHSENVVHGSILESTIPDVDIRKGSKKRKYCVSYLDMGFTEFADGRPQCVICNKVLPNSSMFPAKL